MKKIGTASLVAMIAALLMFTIAFAIVGNGNFETGDFTNWTKTSFINDGFSVPHGSGGSDMSAIVGTSGGGPLSLSDPHTNGNLLYPAYGDYSARVNSDQSYDNVPGSGIGGASNGNTISQTVDAVLSPDNLAHIRFTYAAVMVDPVGNPHTADEKPYFRVRVINASNSNDVIYDFSSYVGEPGKNWEVGQAFNDTDNWKYIDWQYVDLASSVAHPVGAGDDIIIEVTAAGCEPNGHPGYVYVDEITDGDIAGPSINATGPATRLTGETITYTYTYHNGSGSAILPVVTATQPTGVTFTSVSDITSCNLSSGTVTCNFPSLAALTTGPTFTISGTVTALSGAQIAHGDYDISATGFPTVGGQTVLTDVIGEPEIEVWDGAAVTGTLLTDGSSTVDFGSTVACNPAQKTFTVRNTGQLNLTLTEPISLPANYTLVSSFASTTLAPTETTTFQVRLTDTTLAGTYSGSLSFANNDADENPFNFNITTTITTPATANMQVFSGAALTLRGTYNNVPQNTGQRQLYSTSPGVGLNDGPMWVKSDTCNVASMRIVFTEKLNPTLPTRKSFGEFMGFPTDKATTSFVFPWYNNVDIESQFRVANLGASATDITVNIAGTNYGPFNILAGASRRFFIPSVNGGPVRVSSSDGMPIVAGMRVVFTEFGNPSLPIRKSYSEFIGFPENQLTDNYVFPWHNGLEIDSQLRFANMGASPTTVTINVAGADLATTYNLAAGQAMQVTLPNAGVVGQAINNGPVRVYSSGSAPIIASMRVIFTEYLNPTLPTRKSYTEFLGFPVSQLTTAYILPWYNGLEVDSQLRFANMGASPTTITVNVAGTDLPTTYNLAAGESKRVNLLPIGPNPAAVNGGPVRVSSSGGMPIIVGMRVIFTEFLNPLLPTRKSYTEMIGFPMNQMTRDFVFPWYNNLEMDTQLRFSYPVRPPAAP